MERPTLLVVDDEPGVLESVSKIFEREGLAVIRAPGGREALDALRRDPVHVVLTDLTMPGMSGMDLLRAARTLAPHAEVILMTAYGTVDGAVEAMKEGAYDFVTKPLKRAHLVRAVDKALEKQSLLRENRALRARLEEREQHPRSLIGQSLPWRRTLETVLQAAPSSATVLLLGESGTGKELLAREIHERSARQKEPFVAVNCAAIPESILEAELFGYERGAFTGAVQRRDGRFALADGGTLFLDEVGEIPPQVQVKLLRVLEEGEIERLGGRSARVDIRLVAATNRDLPQSVRDGRFRDDLYYRLNVIAVRVPPLRERREDIPLLAAHFVRLCAHKNQRPVAGLTREALALMQGYDWPGNVRELENAIERAVVLGKGELIDVPDLPADVRGAPRGDGAMTFPLGTPLEEIERQVIHETLRHAGGDKRRAAQLLGIATRTIYRRLEEPRDGDPIDDAATETEMRAEPDS
jgi:two-component system, NtrC family, response regulator HydG